MALRLTALFGFTLILGAGPAMAADDGPNDEADARAFLKGKGEGALANPIALTSESRVDALCTELQGRRSKPHGDAVERGIERRELKMKAESARRAIYRTLVAPRGFKIGEYKMDEGVLPLKLDQQLVALDGALTMAVLNKRGAEFKLDPKAAAELVARIDRREIGLDVLFRLDAGKDMSPCFSAPKSAAYALRIESLAYALVDASTSKVLATALTPSMKEMKAWLEPGAASLKLSVHSTEGTVDQDRLSTALESKRKELEACLQPVLSSADATAVLGYAANVSPAGGLNGLRLEVEAGDHHEVTACVEKVIGALSAGKSAQGGRASLTIAVERDGDAADD